MTMNHETAREAGADRAKSDGKWCDYYKGDLKIGTRKSGSVSGAYQDAKSYNDEISNGGVDMKSKNLEERFEQSTEVETLIVIAREAIEALERSEATVKRLQGIIQEYEDAFSAGRVVVHFNDSTNSKEKTR